MLRRLKPWASEANINRTKRQVAGAASRRYPLTFHGRFTHGAIRIKAADEGFTTSTLCASELFATCGYGGRCVAVQSGLSDGRRRTELSEVFADHWLSVKIPVREGSRSVKRSCARWVISRRLELSDAVTAGG